MSTSAKEVVSLHQTQDMNPAEKQENAASHVRFVTAASLFDGHDASINIMRRILQGAGAEVIHLGHNRSVAEVVNAAIQEDVQGIAISSYQGGHVEYFKYMIDMLRDRGCGHIQVFGGGGGVIVADEIDDLHSYGVARIYTPEDGQQIGLQGMIDDMLSRCHFDPGNRAPDLGQELAADAYTPDKVAEFLCHDGFRPLSSLLTALENENYPLGARNSLGDVLKALSLIHI